MTLKQWPKDEKKLLTSEELITPVIDAIKEAYYLESKCLDSIPYNGYTTGSKSLAVCPPPDELLNKDGLAYAAARDRDPIHLLVLIAFQLGVEQGMRMCESELALLRKIADDFVKEK